MNIQLTKNALSAAIALTLVACGGSGGGGVAGIGGSGYISSGSVTGFGSVFVNGVEFETDSATFDVDGDSGTQDDLGIGMVVKVSGSINDDGITGTASSISFDDELQGPVTGPIVYDADVVTGTFTVLGVTVIVDSGSTTFDIDSDTVPANTPFDFDNISVSNNVEVSGFFDTAGDLLATRVELKNIIFDTSSIVELKGMITGLSSTTFNLVNFSGLSIDASSATLDDLPNGLVDGQLVEVKGTLDSGFTILTASKVEAEDNSADDTDEFEIEGLIANYDAVNTTFTIDGISVDASNARKEPLSLVLGNDAHVEVEGAIVNGVLIATEVESEDGSLKVHAKVTAVPPITAPNTFEVSPVSGQSITITVSTSTQFEDDVDENKFFSIDDLLVTDFVEVEGFDDGNGGISATEVDVREESDILVQGNMQTFVADTSIEVLGVTFAVDTATGETEFEDIDDNPMGITQAQFIMNAPIGSLVKIKDKFNSGFLGVADEIDIETP